MRNLVSVVVVCIVALLSIPTVHATVQQTPDRRAPFDFYFRGPYREGVPRPDAILGYELGTRETTYWQQDKVVRAIADASKDRMRVIQYGMSNEGRPLRIVVISSPENIARLDDIRAKVAKLADPRTLSKAEADEIEKSTPVIVWINQNIHGNESTSFESTMPLIYNLAASEDPGMLEMLKNCVVVVNPSFNPDGHERWAVYHNSMTMGDTLFESMERDEPWAIQGRYNHYRFDMNRDKLAVSQIEVRQEIAEYLKWLPQVYVDQHGEVDQYFFPPVALAINMNTDPAFQERWLQIYGKGNAAAFDAYGWDYFNRKVFDFFAVGYLDVWATFQGAIGMTYETDGGGHTYGIKAMRDDGTIVTLRDGIAHHLVAALATIKTSSDNRELRLRDFVAFRQAAIDEGKTGAMKRVVFTAGKDAGRAALLAATLRRSGVEVGVATASFSSAAAHAYSELPKAAAAQKTFEQGTYVVDLSQPLGRWARAVLEPEAKLNPEFVTAELARRDRNDKRGKNTPQEYPGFYDVTAWSLPLAFGVDAYWLGDDAAVAVQQLGPVVDTDGSLRVPYAPEGRVIGGRGTSAYLFPYDSNAAARLALLLLGEGFRLGVTPYEMKAGGKVFPRGTIVIRTMRNPENLASRVAALARETGVDVTAVDSEYADDATTGVGSEEIRPLKRPSVLLAAGDPVGQTSFGAIWYMFERELGYPITAVNVEAIPGVDLTKFNVILLPDGYAGAYADRLGKGGLDKLKAWVDNGGTLVAFGGAAQFLAGKDVKFTTARVVGSDDDDAAAAAKTDKAEPAAAEPTPKPDEKAPAKSTAKKDSQAKEVAAAPETPAPKVPVPATPLPVPGAIYQAKVDQNYFMSYGYDQPTIAVPINSDFFLRPSKDGANVVTFASDAPRLSGFIWPKNTEQLLRGTAYVVEEPTGSGHVILFTEDIAFRRLWRGLDRLLLNSVIFGPGY